MHLLVPIGEEGYVGQGACSAAMNGKSMTTTSLTHLRSTGNDAHAAPGGDWGMSSAASPLPAASGLEAWRSRDSVNRKLLAVADVVAAYSALVLASIGV